MWAAEQAVDKLAAAKAEFAATGKSRQGSVTNMSLGGSMSQALNDAVNKAAKSGMHFAVTPGNDNKGACSCSPAFAEKAITIGTSTLDDGRAYQSIGLSILST